MRLTDAVVRQLPLPDRGYQLHFDEAVKGFGVRITQAGARSFFLQYRTRTGRSRRYTIGSFPDWQAAAARDEARRLKRLVDQGEDPLGDLETLRSVPTMADLCARYLADRSSKFRPSYAKNVQRQIEKHILPAMRHRQVAEVTFADCDALHRRIGSTSANRVLATLSSMFTLAIRLGWREGNPCRGVERNDEPRRERYLSAEELVALTDGLTRIEDREGATIIRLLMLTGARTSEVLGARWTEFDFASGVWTKPAARTKQGKIHRIPLSAPALKLLSELRAEWPHEQYLFPQRGGHRRDLQRTWRQVRKATGLRDLRVHDLRHSYASWLASAGMSLPVIGALLGHSQPSTTSRYAHLLDDPLRAATEKVGSLLSPAPAADAVVRPIRRNR